MVAGTEGETSERPLEQVADTADRVADDQRELARRARRMQDHLDRGWSWSRVLDEEPSPRVIELIRRSRKVVAGLAAAFTATLARELSREGESRRQIARRLEVTHQRVSAVLRDGDRRAQGF
jgi:hypothetical protein